MKAEKIFRIIFITMLILLMVFAVLGAFYEGKNEDKLWNNGYCSECGCPWCYQDMYHLKNSGNIYIYADKEGHTIEIHTNHGFGIDNK